MKLVWVGLAFLVAVFVLGVATLVVGDINIVGAADQVYFYVRVPEVLGLKENDEVRVDGLPLGKVTEVSLADPHNGDLGGVYINCRIERPIELYKDSSIMVEGFALIGGAYVAVRRGSPDTGVTTTIARGKHDQKSTALRGQVDLGFMKEFSRILNQNERNLSESLANIRDVTENLKVITDDFKQNKGAIPETFTKAGEDLRRNLDALREDLKVLITNADKTVTNVNSAVDGLKESINAINQGKGSLGKVIHDPQLYDNLNATAKEINEFVKEIRNSQGTLNAVLKDPKLKDDVTTAVSEIRGAAESINKVVKAIETGWIPKFVQDQEVPDKIKSGLEGLDKTLGRAGRSIAYLHGGYNSFPDSEVDIGRLNIVFWPSDDKFLLFGATLISVAGSSDKVTTEDNIFAKDDQDFFGLEVQLAYRIPIAKPFMIRAGMIEGKAGGAIDFDWSQWGVFTHPVKFTVEVRDTYKSVREEDIDENLSIPMIRAQLKTPIFPYGYGWFGNVLHSLKFVVGGSRLFAGEGEAEYYIGLSLEYEEEDIRTILGLVSASR